MKLPFVLLSRERYNVLMQSQCQAVRAANGHRWLAEFDWLLKPMWDYIFQSISAYGEISEAREKMRKALTEKERG